MGARSDNVSVVLRPTSPHYLTPTYWEPALCFGLRDRNQLTWILLGRERLQTGALGRHLILALGDKPPESEAAGSSILATESSKGH